MASKGALSDDEEMKKAIEQQREAQLASGLAQAGGQIGAAISGQRFDPSAYKPMQEMAQAPVEDLQRQRASQLQRMGAEKTAIELGQMASAADPTSPESKLVTGYMKKKLGLPIADEMSLSSVQRVLPTLQAGIAREEAGKDRALRQSQMMDERKLKHIQDVQNEFNRDDGVKKAREGIVAAEDVQELLASNNPIADETSKSRLARLAGEVGVLTDNDIKRFAGSKATRASFAQEIERMATGKLTPENRKYMLDVANLMKERRQNTLAKYAKEKAGQISTRLGVPAPEAFKYMLPSYEMDSGKKMENEQAEPSKSIGSVEQTGQKKIVKKMYSPSRNQTKIIYADGTEEIKDGR